MVETLSPPDTGDGSRRRLLLVEDDRVVASTLSDDLTWDRFDVVVAASGEEALRALPGSLPDIALVDLGLPGITGIDVVRAVRDGHPDALWDEDVPIIVLSGRSDTQSVVRAIAGGADDFVAKPFAYPELLARIDAHVRRRAGSSRAPEIVVGPLRISRRGRTATVEGVPVSLANKEFALLVALARDPGRVMGKSQLLREVWGFASATRTRTLDTHASRLRTKLRGAGLAGWVSNLWGVGYRLLPEED